VAAERPSPSVAPARATDVLRRFTAPRTAADAEERCDLCKTPVASEHPHLADIGNRRLLCACAPCALLFDHRGASAGRYKRVPTQRRRLRDLRLGAAFWERLQIPVRLAFFFENSQEKRVVAFYPGPAGATESLLPLDAWREVVEANPVLGTIEADVEAMLLRGREGEPAECYLVPIDVCYALTGMVRRSWKGFEGGTEAWAQIDRFFADLAATARDASGSGTP
jgi:Family of unknown function (DUF5947)